MSTNRGSRSTTLASRRSNSLLAADRPERSAWFAPEKPQRRLRDAELWRDALEVYTSIAKPQEQWQRELTIDEALAIHQAAMAHLESRDPELYRAVQWLNWRDTDRATAHLRL